MGCKTPANKRKSASRNDPPPPLSQVPLWKWFSSKEAWESLQKVFSKMPIVKPRYLTEGLLPEDRYSVFWELLDIQGLRPVIFMQERYYPRLMAAAVTTLSIQDSLDRYGHGNFRFTFKLAGGKYALGLDELASIWGLQNRGILFKGGSNPNIRLRSYDYERAQRMLRVTTITVGKYSVGGMSTNHHLLHYMLTYILLPRKGNHGIINEEDLIILWAMVEKREINWPYLMAHRLMIYAFGKLGPCLGHGMLWTKVFEYLGIDLSGEDAVPIDVGNVITQDEKRS
ncbi:hypothetical protein PIB30_075545 [Stylosanthes scabra]|uniref:Uncharacterized protein n=1 Tax=Stylosanthes scabra TaxID=79078 RepID=A0ABU6ZNQ9_9FABA|nr:hypothetical protein [Stylosanthes scabra]